MDRLGGGRLRAMRGARVEKPLLQEAQNSFAVEFPAGFANVGVPGPGHEPELRWLGAMLEQALRVVDGRVPIFFAGQ